MEKRLFIAFLITIVFLFGYNHFLAKRYPKQTPVSDEVDLASQENQAVSPPLTTPEITSPIQPGQETQDLPKAIFGDFIVTYSTKGGYIKKVTFVPSGDQLLFEDIGLVPEAKDKPFTAQVDSDKIVFTSLEGETKEFIFQGYSLTMKLGALSPQSTVIFSNTLSHKKLEPRYQEFFYSQNNMLERKPFRSLKQSTLHQIAFAGARNMYFCASLMKGEYDTIKWEKRKYKQNNKNQEKVYLILPSCPSEIYLYIGPQREKDLQPFDLKEIMHYGFFHAIALGILKLLHFFYFLTKSWGLSIVFFSITAYAALFPLTFKSSKGMKEMREFQTLHKQELAKVKEKYKDNPHKIHQATMELYKKHGVNPLRGCSSGCLPLFFQIPLIWAFWSVTPRAWEFKGASFLWIQDLSLPDKLFSLPFSLPFFGEWVNILPLLTAIIMYVQMKFANPGIDPEHAQQQKMFSVMMLVMIVAFFYN
ncbi:MAG: membrane protein insertase YidC [Candidatus Omnitrophota bacterium]|nr:MAG: membrane protein insertase YidC [Candidatus Omnitrophota bacterium]